MAKTDHPLIYCNGCSYSNNDYHPDLDHNTYANAIGEHLDGYVINRAVNGSSNRRIVRTTMLDCLEQRSLNPEQPILAVIGLSFDLRKEFWIEDATNTNAQESNFRSYNFTNLLDWRERLFGTDDFGEHTDADVDSGWFNRLAKAQAYFHSPVAERINTFTDLILLRSLFKERKINLLTFQAPPVEPIGSEHVLDQLRKELTTPEFVELETLSFTQWAWKHGYPMLDDGEMGHPGPEGHRAFAEQVLIPRLDNDFQM